VAYNDVMASDANLLPIQYANEVIKQATQASAVLSLSQTRRMTTRQQRMPATALLAGAYFVGSASNDFTSLKQTTRAQWQGVNLIVEDIAVLVALPDAFEMDSGFDVWAEVVPQISEAIGATFDAAALFGTNKPATWPAAIVPSIPAGQRFEVGDGTDLAQDVSSAAAALKRVGFNTNGFAAEPGFGWDLVGLRTEQGVPIYQPDLQNGGQGRLYGFPLNEVANGAWDADDATLIGGDWTKSLVGLRQDVTLTRHPDGVINDEDGAVVFNAMQQDASIWRAVMRVAWARANPATRLGPNPGLTGNAVNAGNLNGNAATPLKFPWWVLEPAGS
jgi:HK97 family phage major capsid protein